MASALVKRTTSRTNNSKTSRTRDDPRFAKQQLNASLVVYRCARVCLFAAQMNKCFMPRDGIFLSSEISVLFRSFCGRKKKTANQFPD